MQAQKAQVLPVDPLGQFPTEIMEKIFEYLTAKDVNQCSLLNYDWHSALVSSLVCSKKFKLNIDNKNYGWTNMTDEERQSVMLCRKFSKVDIYEATDISDSLSQLLSLQGTWKKVYIARTEFSSTSEFIEFIESIQGSVESLEFGSVTIKRHEQVETKSQFTKLKSLKILNSDDLTRQFKCPVIENLNILHPRTTSRSGIIDMLQSMTTLKKFHLDQRWLDIIFRNGCSDQFSFQIEDVSVTTFCRREDHQPRNLHFKSFLVAQSKSIKTLNLGHLLGADQEMWRLAYEMGSIKTLSAHLSPAMEHRNDFLHKLPMNRSIETLDLKRVKFDQKAQLFDVLRASPNVTKLEIKSIDVEIGTIIQSKLRNLQSIVVMQPLGRSGAIEAIFPSLKFIQRFTHFTIMTTTKPSKK